MHVFMKIIMVKLNQYYITHIFAFYFGESYTMFFGKLFNKRFNLFRYDTFTTYHLYT